MNILINKNLSGGFKMLYAWGGQSLCVINGKTKKVSYQNPGYGTLTYNDDYVTIYFTSTYGMQTYAVSKQKFKYSCAYANPDSPNGGVVEKTCSSGETIVPKSNRGDGSYTSTLIIY